MGENRGISRKKEGAIVTVTDSANFPMPIVNQKLEAKQDMPGKVRAFIDLLIKPKSSLQSYFKN